MKILHAQALKKVWAFLLFLFPYLLIFSCTKEEEFREIEPVFVTSDIDDREVSYAYLFARIDEDQEAFLEDKIEDHGFVWSEKEGNTLENAQVISLGKWEARYSISAFIKNLKGSTTYYARAYIKMNEKVYYGNEISFRTSKGSWKRKADFPGDPKVNATGFSINGKGYVLGGSEVWEYDPEKNSWHRKKDFPVATQAATSFVIEGIAYVYCGGLWQYQAEEDSWISIPSPQDEWRYFGCDGVSSFVSGGKAFIGGGNGNLNKDLVMYDPKLNEWATTDYPAPNVAYAASFSLNQVGYIVGGSEMGNSLSSSVLSYNVPEGSWERKDPFHNKNWFEAARTGMVCFQFENSAYVGMGYGEYPMMYGTSVESQYDFYQYNPYADIWEPQTDLVEVDEQNEFHFLGRTGGVSFVIGEKGYLGLGANRDYNNEAEKMEQLPLKDFWEFSVR